MCNMNRMTAFLMSALLMGAAVCTPAMAAEIPAAEETEVSTEASSEEVPEDNHEEIQEETAEESDDSSESTEETADTVSEESVETKEDSQETAESELLLEENEQEEQDEADASVSEESEEQTAEVKGSEAEPVVDTSRQGRIGFADAIPITVGSSTFFPVSEGSQEMFFRFIPEDAGAYVFSAETDDHLQTRAVLLDEKGDVLHSDYDGSGDNGQFEIKAVLDAGNTYYLNAATDDYEDVEGFTVHLEKIDFYAEEGDYDSMYAIGDTVHLSINAYSDEPLEYTWYDNDGDLVEEATSSEYSFVADKAGEFGFRVEVTDGINYEYLSFSIQVYNKVIVDEERKEIYADPGEEVTLEVNAHAADGSDLIYEWYEMGDDYKMSLIEGQTSNQLKITADKSGEYRCSIAVADESASSSYGPDTYCDVWFIVCINNNLVAYPEGAGTDSDGNKQDSISLNVNGTDSVNLKTIVEASDKSGLTFAWYKVVEHEDWGWPQDDEEKINNLTDTLSLNNPKSGKYICEVQDRFGNVKSATFKVLVNGGNNLTVIPEGAGTTNGERDKYVRLPFSSGTSTLKTIVTADDLSGLTYVWYRSSLYESGWTKLTEFNGKSAITVNNAGNSCKYKCVVTDKYGNYDYAFFELVKNNLRLLSANGEVEHETGCAYRITVTKTPGVDLTLKTIVEADDLSQIEYSWSRRIYDEYYEYDLSSTDSCVVKSDIPGRYMCDVSDGYDNWFFLEYYIEIGGCTEHVYGDWTITKEATCKETGSREKVCENCGHTVTEEIPVTDHVWEEGYTVDKEATCAEEGSESIHCSVCGEIKEGSSRAIEKTQDHTLSKTEAKEADCTTAGNKEYWTCSVCGKVFSDGEGTVETTLEATVIPAKGHVWKEDYTVDKEATCAEEGSESIHCSVCGEIKEGSSRAIGKTQDHKYGEWTVTKEATCTEEGSNEKVCSVCGDKITESIPANGHQWEKDYTVDKDATCTEEGSESIHCSVCDEIQEGSSRAIEKTAHTLSKTEAKEAACTEDGNIEYWTCSECGKVFSDEEGTEEITADDTVVPAKGHTFSKTEGNKATCTEDGNIEYWTCSECGKLYSDEEGTTEITEKDTVIKSLGHNWSAWTVTKPATETETGLREKTCSVCGEKVEEVIPVLKGTWIKNSVGWWYQWSDGSYPRDRFLDIDGKTYYFNSSGYMVTGWQKIDGDWYYFNGSGVKQTGWQKIGSTWYYFDEDGVMAADEWVGDYYFSAGGAMATGWQKIDGSWYYFNGSGVKQTGWQRINNTWYFFDEDGVMAADEWVDNYYFSAGGAMVTGWQKIDGDWYYFNGSGVKQIGWQRINNTWYFFDEDGVMAANEWVGNYYFSAGGAMVTGWQKIDGDWYYFNGSGVKQTGWQRISNSWYFFDEDGVMVTNIWIGSYYLGADGKWIPGYKAAN